MAEGAEAIVEVAGDGLDFFVEGGAGVGGSGSEDESAGRVEDLVSELEADVLEAREPELDGEEVIVASGGFEGELAVGDGEGHILLLPEQERSHPRR